jgi:uncharacterized protein DUF2490
LPNQIHQNVTILSLGGNGLFIELQLDVLTKRKDMKKILATLLMSILLAGSQVSWAKNSDFQLWTELKYAHTFPDNKLTLRWAEENRFFNDVSKYGLFNTTLGFDYRVLKWLRPGYFQRIEKKVGSPTEFRLIPTLEFLTHMGPIQFEDRNRFEVRMFTDDDVRFRYRNRAKFGYTFKTSPVSFTPYISDEIFVETERTNPDQNRAIVGNGFGFCKDHITFDLYYLLRSDKNQGKSGWTNINVLGTSLGFKY